MDPFDIAAVARASRAALGSSWSSERLGSLAGLRALVTGGTRGLGRRTAEVLLAHGAEVTITGRSESVREAAARIGATPLVLDLSNLAAAREAAEGVDGPIDLLVNNAGTLWGPRRETVDGHEFQVGTNYLGAVTFTIQLLPRLLAAGAPRIVWVSSLSNTSGRLEPRFLDAAPNDYEPTRAYATSKLALLAASRELGRRAARAGLGLRSVAAHPGWVDTELMTSNIPAWARPPMRLAERLFAAPVDRGAEPILAAALARDLPSGAYVGPRLGFVGRPWPVPGGRASRDPGTAARTLDWALRRSGAEIPSWLR